MPGKAAPFLVVVRHGATPWNENGYCQGRRDVPLSQAGREQVGLLKAALENVAFSRVYSSPLQRAQETARILGRPFEILVDLNEIDRGHWEGHAMEEVKRRWGKLYEAWYSDPTDLAMPGGERFSDLWARAGRVLESISGEPGVLLCGHKAINRVILARALGRTPREVWSIPQPQACRSLLRLEQGGWRPELIGDASHLPVELRSDS